MQYIIYHNTDIYTLVMTIKGVYLFLIVNKTTCLRYGYKKDINCYKQVCNWNKNVSILVILTGSGINSVYFGNTYIILHNFHDYIRYVR